MAKLREWINRLLGSASKPTKPAPSMFSAEAKAEADDKQRDAEMQLAIEKERSRKSAM